MSPRWRSSLNERNRLHSSSHSTCTCCWIPFRSRSTKRRSRRSNDRRRNLSVSTGRGGERRQESCQDNKGEFDGVDLKREIPFGMEEAPAESNKHAKRQ